MTIKAAMTAEASGRLLIIRTNPGRPGLRSEVTLRNIFDQYSQPENRITHALLTALNEDRELLGRFVREHRRLRGQQVVGVLSTKAATLEMLAPIPVLGRKQPLPLSPPQ